MKLKVAVSATAVAVAGLGFAGMTSASATTDSVSCSSSSTTTITPGLTFTPAVEKSKIKGVLTGCSGTGLGSNILSGKISAATAQPKGVKGDCVSLATPGTNLGSGKETLSYKVAKGKPAVPASHLVIHLTAGATPGTFAATGTITSGSFTGLTVSSTVTATGENGDCSPAHPITVVTEAGPLSIS